MPSRYSRRSRKARQRPSGPAAKPQAPPAPDEPTEPASPALSAAPERPRAGQTEAGRLRVVRSRGRAPAPGARVQIGRDYGYVRGELLRIAVLSGVIFAAIGVLSIVLD